MLLKMIRSMYGNSLKRLLSLPYEKIFVECYSGFKANERPVAFTFQERRWEVAEIVDRWYEGGLKPGHPQANYFKVRTVEGNLFLLRYLSLWDAWSIWLEESETEATT